jgi:hypothetical protein
MKMKADCILARDRRFLALTKGLLAFSISSVERIRVANRSQ